jgi:hypothetical protein
MFSFESEIPGDGRYNWEKSDFICFNSGGAGLQVSFVIRIQEKMYSSGYTHYRWKTPIAI